MSTSGVEI